MRGMRKGVAHPKMLLPVTSIDICPKCFHMSTGSPLAAGPSKIATSSSADAFILGANDDRLQRREERCCQFDDSCQQVTNRTRHVPPVRSSGLTIDRFKSRNLVGQ